jgi:beta-glucosidase
MPTINRINDNLARLAARGQYHYLNINDQLADADGRLRPAMTDPDQLHLSEQAYQIWADALTPILTEYLGPRASTDHAPPPSSDPSTR